MIEHEAYTFPSTINMEDIRKFHAGIHYEIYKVLGAHPMCIHNVYGVRFAVWAPNALSVSVVGDFNGWNGACHPMRYLGYGIYELFIPDVHEGSLYKYQIRTKDYALIYKSDPYGTFMQTRPDNASIVYDVNRHHQWTDKKWMSKRKKQMDMEKPQFIYEVHLGGFMRSEAIVEYNYQGEPVVVKPEGFYNYRELAKMIGDYVRYMGYTHVELMPMMEHPLDGSWGYQVTGYYAPTSRYGTPADFMYFVDYMHQMGIGVILDWVPAHFPKDPNGLAMFDGDYLYEDPNPQRREHPHWGTLVFNYKSKEVSNFLIANAIYWIEEYHLDGLRIDAVASMLYLDYGRDSGAWSPNLYGDHENLEAIEFFKHLNSMIKKRNPDIQLIAEESTAYPMVTESVDRGGLGFDYKWNMGWMHDLLVYMSKDQESRIRDYNDLLFSMVYTYSEKYILVFSHDEVVHGKGSMIEKMPGNYQEKFANLRLVYGYMICHPGRKLLFMGQDYAQFKEFNESKSLEWFMLDYELHKKMQDFVKELLRLYKKYPALYVMDHETEGFQWINNMLQKQCMIAFVRHGRTDKDTLLVVCNFSTDKYERFRLGVPFKGRYKEILNSDATKFGGQGYVNHRVRLSQDIVWDGRGQSIRIKVAPLSISVFQCIPEL